MKLKFLGFSLVELMISLIVISIVTAAFAPVVTKKLKTSDMSIGAASSDYIFDEEICNKTIKNCSVCVKDECVRCKIGYYLSDNECKKCSDNCAMCDSQQGCIKCNDGYYLDDTTCKICPEGCKNCTSSSNCETCEDKYVKSGASCIKCPNHCASCSSSTSCSTCDSGYMLSRGDKGCIKYECGESICILTTESGKLLSIYRYNVGDLGGPKIPDSVKVCYAGEACSYGGTTPTCWQSKPLENKYTAGACTHATSKSAYSGCSRTVCNEYAGIEIWHFYKDEGWRMPSYADDSYISQIDRQRTSFVDPFCHRWDSSSLPQ